MNDKPITELEARTLARRVADEAVRGISRVPGERIPMFNTAEKGNEPEHGFKSMGNFLHDLVKADTPGGYQTDTLRDWATKTAGEMEEGDLSQGGTLVPVEFRSELLMSALEKSVVMPRATALPMKTNRLDVPALCDSTHVGSVYGGVIIKRTGEGEQKTATNPEFDKVSLTLHKLTGMVHVSDELLEDSPLALETYLKTVFGGAISFQQDADFLMGTGVNMALGAFNAANPSLIVADAEGGQGAGTIVFENLLEMWRRLYPNGQDNAVWVANPDTFRELGTMAIPVGAGGVPVFLPANQVAGSPYRTLMGRPLIFSEKMATLGDQGDIGLADFSQYLIGSKGLKTASSIHLRFDYDQTSFRFVMRYDGEPWWLSTLTPLNSADTLSPFVVLSGTRT